MSSPLVDADIAGPDVHLGDRLLVTLKA